MDLEDQQKSPNCPQCLNPPDQNMITCTKCQKSYHIACTNATSDQKSALTYKCPSCNTSPPESVKSTSTRSSGKSEDRLLRLELQRLEEERAIAMEFVAKKYKIMNQHERERLSDSSSNNSISVCNWLAEIPNPIDSEEEVQSDPKAAPENINKITTTDQAAQLPKEIVYLSMPPYMKDTSNTNNSSSGICNKGRQYNCSNNVPSTSNAATMSYPAPISTSGPATIGLPQRQQPYRQPVASERILSKNSVPPYNDPSATSNNSFFNAYQNMPAPNGHSTHHNFNYPNATNFASHAPHHSFTNLNYHPHLNQGHLQARHSLPNNLPTFSGQPEEWPLFSSTFEWSTKICGFTDAENLIRLQKSLSGDALQKVQHLLIHPSNVNWVISILKLLYGQPEKIVNSIKNRIKSTPSVDENDLPSFTAFAINVKSLIATIEASDLINELNNSTLLQELIEKLPPCYQLQWGTKKLQLLNENKQPNMYEFSNWIFNIGISATCITVDNSSKNKKERVNNVNNSSRKGYIHLHNDDRKCFVCNNINCKTIENCQKYISLSRVDKWNVVREHKLCRICLCRHYGQCKKRVQCGVEGCQYYHHSSLHRYSHEENNNNNSNLNVNNPHVLNNSDVINTHNAEGKEILFKIIPITVYGKNKNVRIY